MTHVSKALALLDRSLALLSDGFMLLSDRHSQEAEIRQTARMLAGWSAEQRRKLAPFEARFGHLRPALDPERVRAALYHDPRVGGLGLLRDLQDTKLLATQVQLHWLALRQVARAREDAELLTYCEEVGSYTDRQLSWLDTHIKLMAPQALTVPSVKHHELKASVPMVPAPQSIPDAAFAPLAAAAIVAVIGLLSLPFDRVWLLASLGPSAYLLAVDANHPTTRVYNTVVGHLLGLGSGLLALALLNGWSDPIASTAGVLTGPRLWASVIAVGLSVLVAIPLRAVHPPAAATALLITLGTAQKAPEVLGLLVGIALLGLLVAPVRYLRTGRYRARPRALPGERLTEGPSGTWQPTAHTT